KTVRQIDHLIVLPTGVFIIETKHLKDIVVHGLKKESLGQYASFFKALFPNEENNSEKTFVIEGQSTSSQVQREIKIIDQKNTANVYFNYSTSIQNYVFNYSELKDVPIFTEREEVTNYLKDQLTIQERVFEVEDMLEIKLIIDEFNDQKSFEFK